MESPFSHPKVAARAVAVILIFFLMPAAVFLMYHYTRTGPVEQPHWAERTKNLAELRAKNQEAQETYGWISRERGVVRLPIAQAMELTVKEWQDPAAGRAGLLARLERSLPPMVATNAPAATISK
jgi:hypothetical protein